MLDRVLLTRAQPAFLYNLFARIKDIPANFGTNVIAFRKYTDLTVTTDSLVEGVTPTADQMAITDITATVLDYGKFIILTDKVLRESTNDIWLESAEELGDQAGDTLDQLCRAVVTAGTTVQYASTATATNEISAAMKLTRTEVKKAVRTLKGNNAKPIKRMINPADLYNTVPIGNSFLAICSENTGYDLDDADGWTPVENYPNKSTVMPNEIGSLANVRFLETTNARVKSTSGIDSNDVHCTMVLAKEAYGATRISGNTLVNITTPLGSSGGADPLKQRATTGWKATYVAKILQQGFLVRIEHGVSA